VPAPEGTAPGHRSGFEAAAGRSKVDAIALALLNVPFDDAAGGRSKIDEDASTRSAGPAVTAAAGLGVTTWIS
jgi:hypothetical protein